MAKSPEQTARDNLVRLAYENIDLLDFHQADHYLIQARKHLPLSKSQEKRVAEKMATAKESLSWLILGAGEAVQETKGMTATLWPVDVPSETILEPGKWRASVSPVKIQLEHRAMARPLLAIDTMLWHIPPAPDIVSVIPKSMVLLYKIGVYSFREFLEACTTEFVCIFEKEDFEEWRTVGAEVNEHSKLSDRITYLGAEPPDARKIVLNRRVWLEVLVGLKDWVYISESVTPKNDVLLILHDDTKTRYALITDTNQKVVENAKD